MTTRPSASAPLPEWLQPVRVALDDIAPSDLTRFTPPEGSDARPGAVLVLFGGGPDSPHGPDLLLTERNHAMRSHPGQVSFPGGSLDPGEGVVEAALREASEEVGLRSDGVQVFGTLPQLWLPPSNFAVTPVLAWWREESPLEVRSPDEVESIVRAPIAELLDPAHRVTVTHPSGYRSPGFVIGGDAELVLWGFTAGIVARLFDFVGWTRPWDETRERELPSYMLQGRVPRTPAPAPAPASGKRR